MKVYVVRNSRSRDNPTILFVVSTEERAKFIVERYNRKEWEKLYHDRNQWYEDQVEENEFWLTYDGPLPHILQYTKQNNQERLERDAQSLANIDTFEKWLAGNTWADWFYQECEFFDDTLTDLQFANWVDDRYAGQFTLYTREQLDNA